MKQSPLTNLSGSALSVLGGRVLGGVERVLGDDDEEPFDPKDGVLLVFGLAVFFAVLFTYRYAV
jgi:hypothetical protein